MNQKLRERERERERVTRALRSYTLPAILACLLALFATMPISQSQAFADDGNNPTTAALKSSSSSGTRTAYRLYNPYSGEHLFTLDTNEYSSLAKIGWKQEGTAWTAPSSSNTPVYRLYNPYSGDHHFTTDKTEYDNLGKIGWNQEDIGWYSDDAQGTPVYRLFNQYVTVGTHLFTTDKSEYETLPTHGWKKEDIAWYGLAEDDTSKEDDSSSPAPATKKFAVTFNTNGGSSVASQSIESGKTASKPDNPTKSESTFVVWCTDEGLTMPYNFESAVSSNLTLYAKWQPSTLPAANPPDSCVTVYRLINQTTGSYFYTANESEIAPKVENGWVNEGVAWYAPGPSGASETSSRVLTCVYRCYNQQTGYYEFTCDNELRDQLITMGWTDEGVAFYSDNNKAVPVYGLHNAYSGGSFYTTSTEEYTQYGVYGWTQRGVAWYAAA